MSRDSSIPFLQEMSVQYWPIEVDDEQFYGKITVKKTCEESHGDFILRRFEIDCDKESTNIKTSITVNQLQFLAWPEHETPSNCSSLVELIEHVNEVQMRTENRPIIVMCK